MERVLVFVCFLSAVFFLNAQSGVKRVIGMSGKYLNGTEWVYQDSASYQYIGNRQGNQGSADTYFDLKGYDAALIYNTNNPVLEPREKELIEYNENDSITSWTNVKYNFGSWINNLRYTYKYNIARQLEVAIYEAWNGVSWDSSARDIYTYDINGQRITYTAEWFSLGMWTGNIKATNAYDPSRNLLSTTYERWESGNVSNDYRIVYTYDASNNRLSRTQESWNNNAWQANSRTVNTYSAGNKMLSATYQNLMSNVWENFARNLYTYDAGGNILTDIYQEWQNGDWQNDLRYTYTYNSADKVLSSISETWNLAWQNEEKFTYTYNSENKRLSEAKDVWSANAWELDYKEVYPYDQNGYWLGEDIYYPINGTPELKVVSRLFYESDATGIDGVGTINSSVYPNPAKVNTLLSFEVQQSGEVEWALFNINGVELKRTKQYYTAGRQSMYINLEGYSSGIYIYQMQSSDGTKGQGKIIKQ